MSRYGSKHIGADEVRALIGKWQSIVGATPQHDILGADVSYNPYGYRRGGWGGQGWGGQGWGGQGWGGQGWGGQGWGYHRHHHGPNPWRPWGAPATSMRDHRRAALYNAYVSGDQTAVGALALMGAEEQHAAATGTPPHDATVPAPPLPPADAAAASASHAAVPPAPVPPPGLAPPPVLAPAPPPPDAMGPADHPAHPEHHRRRHHRRHREMMDEMPMAVPYAMPPRNMLVDRPGPDRADRILLPMSSGVNILPNTSAQITSRPQNVAFRPERLIIGGTPGDWIVNDIKVGNRSQFSQSGDVPGEVFASTAIDSFVSFETVQTAMDFVMLVTFVGASESGAPFVCAVLGTAAV